MAAQREEMDLLKGSDFNLNDLGIESSEKIQVEAALDNFLFEDVDKIEKVEDGPATEEKDNSKEEASKKEGVPPESLQKKRESEQALKNKVAEDLLEEVDPVEDEEVDETEDSNEGEAEKNLEVDPVVALSKDLIKLGVFTPGSDGTVPEIKTQKEFLEQFNLEKKKGASIELNNFLSQFGDDYLEAFDKIYVKGLHPKEYYQSESQIADVRDLDLENEDNQKEVVRQYYINVLGYGAERAKKKIDKLATDGELDDEAVFAQEKILTLKQQEQDQKLQLRQQEIQRKQQEEAYYNNSIANIIQQKLQNKNFDGIPITDKTAQETADYLITKKWKLQNGDLLSDFEKDLLELKSPNNLEKRVKLGLLMKKGLDLSKVKTAAISEKSDDLFESLVRKERQEKRESRKPNKPANKDYFNIQI